MPCICSIGCRWGWPCGGWALRELRLFFSGREVQAHSLPADNREVERLNRGDTTVCNGGKYTAFGSCFPDVTTLQIAWVNDPGLVAENLTLMNMPQCPVVVTLGRQIL